MTTACAATARTGSGAASSVAGGAGGTLRANYDGAAIRISNPTIDQFFNTSSIVPKHMVDGGFNVFGFYFLEAGKTVKIEQRINCIHS